MAVHAEAAVDHGGAFGHQQRRHHLEAGREIEGHDALEGGDGARIPAECRVAPGAEVGAQDQHPPQGGVHRRDAGDGALPVVGDEGFALSLTVDAERRRHQPRAGPFAVQVPFLRLQRNRCGQEPPHQLMIVPRQRRRGHHREIAREALTVVEVVAVGRRAGPGPDGLAPVSHSRLVDDAPRSGGNLGGHDPVLNHGPSSRRPSRAAPACSRGARAGRPSGDRARRTARRRN